MRQRGYSLLMVLLMLGLLGIAVGGIFAIVLRGAQSSGAMIERRRTFYACDGMGRQLASLGQSFLSRNILEDVPEPQMERELRAFLPRITPPGFESSPTDLVIPERKLQDPAPIEIITTGPFAGLQVKLQTIDMRFEARRTASGAVCRAEQTLSLGRIALFQFFTFSDLPLLDLSPPLGDVMLLRGRMHSNGRFCLGGAPVATNPIVNGPFAVRLDARITAVERILHASSPDCGFGGGDVGIVGFRAPGEQQRGQPDRLLDERLLEPISPRAQSACTNSGACPGGWRSFALRTWIGRVQDTDHEVQELTLPIDPPVRFTQVGWAANGTTVLQQMTSSSSRPNTRFLVEPVLAGRDPAGFSRNKMADKAQLRVIDGVWYVKDPGPDNSPDQVADDGPWPGIPIWSDHPGEFTAALPAMGIEGVEGTAPLQVGQSDIARNLEAATDTRLGTAKWSRRLTVGASPTPRRFSYYAFVDRRQADIATNLTPQGMGLQFGRVERSGGGLDVDPPPVVSYGGIVPVSLSRDQSYWLPGVRLTDNRSPTDRVRDEPRPSSVGFCGGRSDAGAIPGINDVDNNVIVPAVPRPIQRFDSDDGSTFVPVGYPAPNSPLPSDGTAVAYAPGTDGSERGRICSDDNGLGFRRRMRLALLESARTGFSDTNLHADTRFPNPSPPQADILPMNVNLHALQEALADRTPGELGSYFCEGCLWESFNGTIFVTNTWKGSMLSQSFPDGLAAPPPSPVVDDVAILSPPQAQPRAPKEDRSTTGPLPYPVCAAPSDESATALAQVVGHRFVEADEVNASTGAVLSTSGFTPPFQSNAQLRQRFRRVAAPPGRPTLLSPPEAAPTRLQQPADLLAPTSADGGVSFTIPACAAYSLTDGPFARVRPTAVRLINGRTINRNASICGADRNDRCQPVLHDSTAGAAVRATGMVPEGLNVITNVPLYIVGDTNLSSEIEVIQSGQEPTDWVPLMVAGDTVTTMSNAWSDQGSRWGVGTNDSGLVPGNFGSPREAVTTQYNMLVLTGLAGGGVFTQPGVVGTLATSGGGLPGVLRLMEDWRDAVHLFRGSLVIGWMPVYTQWRVDRPGGRSSMPPMVRNWQFDRHLNATINQPPDSPVFDVTALRSWRRE
jgi:hypothetical protein